MAKGLADPELSALIKNNPNMVKQKVRLAYNQPEDGAAGLDLMVRLNLFGQEYEKYVSAAKVFADDLDPKKFGGPSASYPHKLVYIASEMEAPQEAIDKLKPLCSELKELLAKASKDLPQLNMFKISFEFPAGKFLV